MGGAARAKGTTTDRAISFRLDDKRFFVAFTVATFLGVLLAIATMQAVNPSGSSSSALAPYIAREFCSKYGAAPTATTPDNDSHLVTINAAPHADRLDSLERKLEELALTIKTLADSSVVISSKLDSELASAARTLEDLGERLHRVENHVFVSEDLA